MKTNKFGFLNKEITLNDIAEFLAIFKPAFKKSILLIALFTGLFAVIGYFAKITSKPDEQVLSLDTWSHYGQSRRYTQLSLTITYSLLQALFIHLEDH